MKNNSDKIFSNPHIYHLAFSWCIDHEIDFFCKFFHKNSNLLLPACGTGRYSENLMTHGFQVDAFDLSSQMLNYAKAHSYSSNINYYIDDMCEMNNTPFKKYDGSLLLNNSLRYILDEEKVKKHFWLMSSYLKEGASYLIEVGLNDSKHLIGKSKSWVVEYEGGIVFSKWTLKNINNNELTDEIKIIHKDQDGVTSLFEEQKQKRWTYEKFLQILKETNFSLEAVYKHNFEKVEDSNFLYEVSGKYYLLLKNKVVL